MRHTPNIFYTLAIVFVFLGCGNNVTVYSNTPKSEIREEEKDLRWDIDDLVAVWENNKEPQNYLLFSYGANNGNRQKGFFGTAPFSKDTSIYNYFQGTFNIYEKGECEVSYSSFRSDQRELGILKLIDKKKLILPFGNYRKLNVEESKKLIEDFNRGKE